MNKHKMTLLSCLLFSFTVLFACTHSQNKISGTDGTSAQNKQSMNGKHQITENQSSKNGLPAQNNLPKDTQIVQKKWNEADYRLPNTQHTSHVQSLSKQFPEIVIFKGNAAPKRVALTFDDGPDNYYTPRILDILRAKGVHGTFFIVGEEAKRFPDMVKRIVMEGNAVGNHSWNHPKLWKLTNDQIKQEIISTQNEIQQLTGYQTNLFRPPYGRVTPEDVVFIHNLGYNIIEWSVDTLDWKGTSASNILRLVNKEVSPGGIILEHCFAGHSGELNGTLQALPQIIDHLRAQGYDFVTVPTLIGT